MLGTHVLSRRTTLPGRRQAAPGDRVTVRVHFASTPHRRLFAVDHGDWSSYPLTLERVRRLLA